MSDRQPNIVIFNPDQYRGDVLGHMGDPAAQTPNLDRFAAEEAVSFRNAFCQLPVCTPSRCSFMSGWYPHVRGHRSQLYMMRKDEPVLLKTLKENGYFVWWGGKNDLVPAQYGYEDSCHVKVRPEGEVRRMHASDRQADWRGPKDGSDYYSFFVGRLDKGSAPYYRDSDWAYVEAALRFIRTWDDERPFCLYLPLTFPHPPYGVEDPWFSAIDRSRIPPRRPEPEGSKASILQEMIRRHGLREKGEAWWNELRAVYYGMCARVDHQFGLIVDALKEAGRYDDTALFFFSDHGDFAGDYGLVNKQYNVMDDNLTRVPFLVKPPAGVPVQPGISEALVELVDFPATVFDLSGIEPDWRHFGKSLLPVVAGDKKAHRDAVFCEGGRLYGEKMWDQFHLEKHGRESLYWPAIGSIAAEEPSCTKAVMCRNREFKYVHRLYESDELYDLRSDPEEAVNRIDDPALADILAAMKDRTMRFYLETADVMPPDLDRRS